MSDTIHKTPEENLQKSAETRPDTPPPKEVLHPQDTAKQYSFHIYPPSQSLAPFVEYYWIMRWDLHGKPPYVAEIIPSSYTNLTFMPEGARITGVTTGKYTYELKGDGAIVGVRFKPGGLHAFWKQSLHALTDTFVSATALFTEATPEYNKIILEATNADAVQRIEQLLQAYNPQRDKNFELVTNILTHLEAVDHPSLADAVGQSGLSERRLQEIFQEYVGVGIKWIILRDRLIAAAELAATVENPNWTVVAQELGYADQSHFINDFKRIIGASPTQYALANTHKKSN